MLEIFFFPFWICFSYLKMKKVIIFPIRYQIYINSFQLFSQVMS
uniref:Uncharacterized protein n=1 Tax=Rhizophora mucronata TaxID=61149 RepID=A0A2P2NEQ4_RHIMU